MTHRLRHTLLLIALGTVASWGAWASPLTRMVAIPSPNIASIPKWVKLLNRQAEVQGELQSCLAEESACTNENMLKWREMMQDAKEENGLWRIRKVNNFFNAYPYITDDVLWGRSDYWETANEFIDKSGDCEDYAIVKYISLKMLGNPESSLRLLVVKDTLRQIPHAVLGVRHEGEEYILDNLSTDAIPARLVSQYRPYYGVNAQTRWIFIQPSKE